MQVINKQKEGDGQFRKLAGYSLLVSSVIIVLIAMMHPVGGDIGHIVHVKSMLQQSHSLAIACLPFLGFGFFGISKILITKSKLSVLSLIISFFGLFAAMIAATINGLTLPAFASNYSPDRDKEEIVKTIITYGKFINVPMAYIFMSVITLSIALWSFLIIKTTRLSLWIGYLGFAISLLGAVALMGKFNLVGLFGFRAFLFGLVIWKIFVGLNMLKRM